MENFKSYTLAIGGLLFALLIFVIAYRKSAPKTVGVNPDVFDETLGKNQVFASARMSDDPTKGPAFMGYNWGPPVFMRAMLPIASETQVSSPSCQGC